MAECNNCGESLKPVFEGEMIAPSKQYENALHLSLLPGYGEYFDGDAPIDILLCNDCASHMLNDVMPNLKEHIYDELDKQGF